MSEEKKDIRAIDEQMAKLNIEKSLMIEKALTSNDADAIYKAQSYLEDKKKKENKTPTAFLFNPWDTYYQTGGFKQTRKRVSFEILKKIGDTPIVGSIYKTRIDQISNFLEFTMDEKEEGYTIRRKRSIFDKKGQSLSSEDKKKIEYINNFLRNGGLNKKWELYNDDLSEFVAKTMRDSLNYDQLAFECQRNRRYELIGQRAIDASTIRLLETVDPRYESQGAIQYDKQFGFYPLFAQVYQSEILTNPLTNNKIIYYPWELGYGQRNQTTDIEKNGYGTSELETALDIVTWSLWGMQYNGNFFKQGSNPKGFINIKNEGISQDIVNDFRQTWRQMLSGVNNCIHGDTNIITTDGYVKVGDLFLKDKEDKFAEIWDGEEFIKGRIYVSGEKKINTMKLNNGITIKTSPEHRFKVVNDLTGLPEWRERKDIKVGDYILTNKNSVKTDKKAIFYKDKEVESDLFEVLGWAIGDGYFGSDENKKRRMTCFYHSIRERGVLQRHLDILQKYDINSYEVENFYTEEQKDCLIRKNNFKSVADSNIKINIIDADFMRFVFSLGFKPSKEGKEIPKFLYSYNSDCKCAFLKGFFSADGHVASGRYIQMSITNDILREQTKQLLLTEGIRCNLHEGKIRNHTHWGTLKAGYILLIKDNKEYFEKIGMIQPHKQSKPNKTGRCEVANSIAHSTSVEMITLIRDYVNKNKIEITKRARTFLSEVICGQKTNQSKVIEIANKVGYILPDFMYNYHFSQVIELAELDESVEMYDVEMYNDKHQFIANGILTHNSHKLPVFSGIDLEWIDLQGNNKDMEFQDWMEFLIIILCSMYTIDPSELGYNFTKAAQIFGQDGQKERLKHSRKKGLKPLLIFFQKVINKYLVSELDEDFEFAFTGLDIDDEMVAVDLDAKKLQSGAVSFESVFEKNMGRKYNEKTDTILNSVFLQMQQMKQYGGQDSNGAVDEMNEGSEEEGAKNPFEDFNNKAIDGDPIMKEVMKYAHEKLNI